MSQLALAWTDIMHNNLEYEPVLLHCAFIIMYFENITTRHRFNCLAYMYSMLHIYNRLALAFEK
jgi:hypothetical protein